MHGINGKFKYKDSVQLPEEKKIPVLSKPGKEENRKMTLDRYNIKKATD